jgi:serine/threonine protein kinase/WD40 repeat protein
MLEDGLEDLDGREVKRNVPPPSFGDYELIEEIARGGMGVVYKARQRSLNRIVALKMILTGRLAGEAELRRFRVEAEVAAGLQHPNIVAIHEVGEFEGQPFFSMDRVEGESLAELAHNEPLPGKRAAAYLKTIAEAVQYAHAKGVLHRDLKPSNILIDQNDQPRITDFGLAKRIVAGDLMGLTSPSGWQSLENDQSPRASTATDLTITGQVLGSPNFMPPEQAAGDRQAVGPAADVYSLGAILYQLLTGRPPFLAENVTQTLRMVAESEAASPRLLNPAVPLDLETICMKCLQKEPSRRYSNAQALAADLDRFLKDRPIEARPVSQLAKSWRWCRRHPAVASLGTGVLVLLVTVAVVSLVSATRLKAANRRATDKLWDAYLGQARAERLSGRAGRRHKSLDLLKKAAQIKPAVELRNEVIACLALEDLRPIKEIKFKIGQWPGFDSTHERFAIIDSEGNLVVRRCSDEQELSSFPGPVLPGLGAEFSPGGGYLAAYRGTDTQRLFQVVDLKAKASVISISSFPVRTWEFTRDEKSILMSVYARPSAILMYSLSSGSEREIFRSPVLPSALRQSPSGHELAISSSDSNDAQVFDLESGILLYALPHPAPVAGVDWHPNGRMLMTCCADRKIYIWDTITKEKRMMLTGHETGLNRAIFSHDGDRIASTAADNSFRLWNPWSGQQILTCPAHGFLQHFTPDDRLIAIPNARAFDLYQLSGRREWRAFYADDYAESGAWKCAWHSDGDLFFSAHRDGVRLWNTKSGHQMGFIPTDSESHAVRFSARSSKVIVATSSGLTMWQVESNFTFHSETSFGPRQSADSLYFNSSETLLACVVGGQVELFEWPSRRSLGALQLTNGIYGSAFSPSGKLCVAWPYPPGQPQRVWDVKSGAVLADLQMDAMTGAIFTPDDRMLIAGSSEEYVCWSTESWKPVWRLSRSDSGGAHGRIALTQDGRLGALTLSAQSIRLFEPSTGRELATLEAPVPQILSWLAFSPDGNRLIASTQTSTIHFWDLGLVRQGLAGMLLDW